MDVEKAIVTDQVAVPSYEDLAAIMEQPLLRPELSETAIAQGCELAQTYKLHAAVVRPSDVDLAVNWVKGSRIVLGTVVDWPHGYSSTSIKTYAVRDMLRRGAKEITTVMNTGKLVSRQFQYLEMELVQMADACHQAGAILKVMLEDRFLNHELKIVACRIAKRSGLDFLGSSALEDVALLKEHLRDRVRIQAAEVNTLEQALQFRDAGCERLSAENAPAILEAWKSRLAEEARRASVIS